MKKRYFALLFCTVAVALLCILPVSAEDATAAEGWNVNVWWEERVAPNLIAYLGMGGLVILEFLPTLVNIKKASGRFDKSSDLIGTFITAAAQRDEAWKAEKQEFMELLAQEREENQARVERYEEQIREMTAENQRFSSEMLEVAKGFHEALASVEDRQSALLQSIQAGTSKTERMVYLGFTNLEEMTTSGCAHKIEEVERCGHER